MKDGGTNLSGAIIAGLEASPLGPFSSIGLSVNQTFGSVDGNATGTYNYQHTFAPAAISGGQVTANYNGGASAPAPSTVTFRVPQSAISSLRSPDSTARRTRASRRLPS